MITACQTGQLPLVKLLVENGAHCRHPSIIKNHLVFAANQGYRDIVLYLLRQPNSNFHQRGINLILATLLELGIGIVNKGYMFGFKKLDLEQLMEFDDLSVNSMKNV